MITGQQLIKRFAAKIQIVMKRFRAMRKMRVGVSYNLFDGEELLEASAKSVRPAVDFITVVYQDVSNGGERRAGSLKPFLEDLKKRSVIDDYVEYVPELKKIVFENETAKRVLGMKICKRHGCNYYMSMDVDEFYRADEMMKAKKFILENGIDISTVSIIEYVKEPTNRLLSNYMFPPEELDFTFYCPFILKIRRPQIFGLYPCLTDPTRSIIKRGRSYLFPKHEIAMHHMSTIRKDLARKYRNSSLTLSRDAETQEKIARTQQSILDFEFDKGRVLPGDVSFIGAYPVLKVENEFSIEL